jgi:hypothetical protein
LDARIDFNASGLPGARFETRFMSSRFHFRQRKSKTPVDVSNTGSGTISTYDVGDDGTLTLANAVAADLGLKKCAERYGSKR